MTLIKTLCALLLMLCCITVLAATKPIGGDFTLTDHHGETFELKQQRGKVVVMFFGYTWCPMVCPESLSHMAQVLRELEDKADQVKVVFITVDPERDTVEKLSQYVPYFNPNLIGLTGSAEATKQVADAYRARFTIKKKHATDDRYAVDHSADIYVLDRGGKVASIIPFGMPAQHILKVVSSVLEEGSAEAQAVKVSKVIPVKPPAKKLAFETLEKVTVEVAVPLVTFRPVDLNGQSFDLSAHIGKPLLINFWASWCPPCRAELPALNKAWAALKDDGVEMLAVNVGENKDAINAFLEDYPIDFPVLMDEAGDSMAQWKIKGMPTTIMLNASGEVVYHIAGERAWDSEGVLSQIRSLSQ
uniref:Cytochrome oxidase biogenesis protein Sco1/SenC/PrrC, putative copper metallochaperone n=1 Tax=uncultured Thiotrichaceae bacterium TaxID=298394 RepID=A0A6S6T165_9GAMM|nr:MAG: Cytochrome oxidase biogenesis protein Sco1/SenC/PrrC, putative copper metallochaperone [uncultured Thiotrichaceae bacterium]